MRRITVKDEIFCQQDAEGLNMGLRFTCSEGLLNSMLEGVTTGGKVPCC